MTVTNGYCTLAQVRAELMNYAVSDTGDDSRIETAIEAASRQIDGWTGWRFWQDGSAQERTFYTDDLYGLDLASDEIGDGISTTTGLVVKVDYDGDGVYETTLTNGTDFILHPRNAATRTPVWPYTALAVNRSSSAYFPKSTYGYGGVSITAKWGWPAVPDDVERACLVLAVDLFKATAAQGGVLGSADLGFVRLSRMNPVAKALLAPYRKPAIG